MRPKKTPAPQSDEEESDYEEKTVKKQQKRVTKTTTKRQKEVTKDAEAEPKRATDQPYEGSDVEDDNSDLFAMDIPKPINFLAKQDKKDRLMISNVEVNNFKSYHGKASIGPFHKSFTSIIGPNGSGKSNLIDALLFVFGFRASKIRSAKVSNLIHKSSGKNPESCTVTVHFQRIIDVPGHYELVKDSSFEISRTAYKNGSSSYAIDGRSATKAEVEARLRLVDIDIEHNRFLILQGEVEQIAMMKPVKTTKSETGMVEYLEDIIGSNRLEPFVKKFQARVNRLNCEVSQQRIARDHARNSKIAMEGPVRTAVDFLRKENEAKLVQLKLDQKRRKRYLDRVEPQRAAVEAKKEEMKSVGEKLDINQAEKKESEEAEQKITKNRLKIDKEFDLLTKEINDLSAEEARREQTIKRYLSDISKSESEKEKEMKKRANLVSVPEKAEKKITKWKEEVAQLTAMESSANARLLQSTTEFEVRSEQLKEETLNLEKAWAEIDAKANKAGGDAKVAREELEHLRTVANSGTKKLEDLKARLTSSEEKLRNEKEEIEQLKPSLEVWKEKANVLGEKLPTVRNEARQLNIDFGNHLTRLRDLASRNNDSVGGTIIVKGLMKEKQAGRIPSFLGRLGDLGVVDKKYEISLCTNYAGMLNNLVVAKEEDGPKIIKWLIDNKQHRQHILSLDRGDYRLPVHVAKQYPLPRIIDLIDCEPELKGVFWHFIKNAIIADTIQDAISLSKTPACRGVTICTLDGSMVTNTGNVVGGGNPYSGLILTDKNKKQKEVTAEDRAVERELAQKVEDLKKKAGEMRDEEIKIDKELSEARHKVATMTNRLNIVTSSVEADAIGIETLKKSVEDQEKEAGETQVDVNELEQKQKIVEGLEKQRDELIKLAKKEKLRKEENQAALDRMYEEVVNCHRKEAQHAKQQRLDLEKDMAKEAANITNSGRNIAKCDEKISQFDKEIGKKKQLYEELQENAVADAALEKKKAELNAIDQNRKEMEKEFEDLTKKQKELRDAETQLEQAMQECSAEINNLKEIMSADTVKADEIQKRLAEMKINCIPQFQFLAESSRPEDVPMHREELFVDENETPEEVERQRKQMANRMTDDAYAREFEMRQKVLENIESYEGVDGDKMVPIEFLTDEQVDEITSRDIEEFKFKLKQSEQELAALKQKVDISCIDSYVTKLKQYNEQVLKLLEVSEMYRKHNAQLQHLKKMRLDEFHSAFEFIGNHLVAVYKMLTDGGDAKLEYIDKDDPFHHGISFMVRPAKKAWKQIQFLSGGEKTLSSLALIFALHMFRPTPFYVMDEIDAALDYRNVSIIAQYVRQKTENAQFIIISLRNNMFELANRLVGIYKVDSCTRNVAIDPQKVCEMAKIISESLGQITCTLPEEVSQHFNQTMSRQNKELTAQEKQYPNFPSSSEISTAEKIVSVEGRFRKELSHTTDSSRPQSSVANAIDIPLTSRAQSRTYYVSAPNIAVRSSSTTSRTPRKERNTESDDTTPPTKRSNSTTVTKRSPKKTVTESTEKRKRKPSATDNEE